MASLRDIRDRIKSVKNTQKITGAMKLVAASKLKRAQDAITAARPYAVELGQALERVASSVAQDGGDETHPLEASELRMKIDGMATKYGRPMVFKEFRNGAISAMHC